MELKDKMKEHHIFVYYIASIPVCDRDLLRSCGCDYYCDLVLDDYEAIGFQLDQIYSYRKFRISTSGTPFGPLKQKRGLVNLERHEGTILPYLSFIL